MFTVPIFGFYETHKIFQQCNYSFLSAPSLPFLFDCWRLNGVGQKTLATADKQDWKYINQNVYEIDTVELNIACPI